MNLQKNSLRLWFLVSIVFIFFDLKQVIAREIIDFLPIQLTRVNFNPPQQSYPAKAKFWGLVANGVNQVSTVTLYPNSSNRLLVTIILPQNCQRTFEIADTKITKVTYSCPQKQVDESSQYTQWVAFHNATIREVKMISKPVKVDNPLYIRNQAFWIIQY